MVSHATSRAVRVAIPWVLLFGSLLLLAISGHGLLVVLARALSSDGALSPAFVDRLLRGQMAFGLAGLLATPALIWGHHLDAGLRRVLRESPERYFLPGLFLAAALGAFVVQERLFGGIAHVTDAVSHLFQAKILASGQLYASLPPCPELFRHEHIAMTWDGRWFTKYTPGHPILLALGQLAGCLPGVVPAASGCAAVFLVLLVQPLVGRVPARFCGLLFLVSPLALLLGGSFMSHTTFLALVLGAAMLTQRAVDPAIRRPIARACAVAAGFLFAWAALTRPQDLALTAVVVLVALLLSGRLPQALRITPLAVLGAGLPLLLLLGWNQALYGSPWVLGYGFTSTGFRTPMFQANFGISEAFPLSRAAENFLWTWFRMNGALFGWPLSIAFVPFAFFAGATRRRLLTGALAACAVVVGVYFFYSYYGAEYEARYYAPLLPPLLVLTAVGLREALCRPRVADAARALLVASVLYAGLHYWPRYIVPTYGRAYEQVSGKMHEEAQRAGLGRAIVLMPEDPAYPLQYPAGFQFMDPGLRDAVLYARDLPQARECLKAAFPDRALYRLSIQDTAIRFDPLH